MSTAIHIFIFSSAIIAICIIVGWVLDVYSNTQKNVEQNYTGIKDDSESDDQLPF